LDEFLNFLFQTWWKKSIWTRYWRKNSGDTEPIDKNWDIITSFWSSMWRFNGSAGP